MNPRPGDDITRLCVSERCRNTTQFFFWITKRDRWECCVCSHPLYYRPPVEEPASLRCPKCQGESTIHLMGRICLLCNYDWRPDGRA